MKLYNDKKRKYTILSTAITALFIALVIVLNVAFLALANHFYWYIDMSQHEVYSLSDEVYDLLKDVDSEVNIYFTVDADKVASTSSYLFNVYQTALQLQSKFDFVKVKCVDIVENPNFFKEYYNTAATDIYTDSVIVSSGTEFRLFKIDAFYITNEEGKIWAYNAEYKFASAILSLTSSDLPVAVFTNSHGETLGNDAKAVMSLFEDGGFDVKEIDLSVENLPEDTRIVIINNPIYDFAGIEAGESNEIDKLDKFLDDFGTLMVFTSPENAGKLTNLSELLDEWGIAFTPDTYVKDPSSSLTVDGKTVIAQYEENTLGASLYLDLTTLDAKPKTVMGNVMPLKITFEGNSEFDGSKDVSAILSASEKARAINGEKEDGAAKKPLMAVSRETRVINNDYYYSYVFVSGSSDYLSNKYINSDAYANSDILYSAMRITGRDRVLADIDCKVLDSTELTITTAQANGWMIALCTTLPVLVSIIGIVVIVRRKNS